VSKDEEETVPGRFLYYRLLVTSGVGPRW